MNKLVSVGIVVVLIGLAACTPKTPSQVTSNVSLTAPAPAQNTSTNQSISLNETVSAKPSQNEPPTPTINQTTTTNTATNNNTDPTAINKPVEIIVIFKAQPPGTPPGTGIWGITTPDQQLNPYPEAVQQVFLPGDKMNVGLRISNKIRTGVTFSKFTYLNKGTGAEVRVGSTSDLMKAWEPGQVDYIAFNNPWSVPNESGTYQLRIYIDSDLVASAIFLVK